MDFDVASPCMHPRHAIRIVAFATLILFTFLVWRQYEPHTYLHGDGAFYANINKSIWNDGTIDQTNYHPHSWLEDDLGWNRDLDQGWSNVSLGRDGRWMPKHSYILPLFSTPFYALFGLTGLLFFQVLMMTTLVVASYAIASQWVSPLAAAIATGIVAAQPVITGDLYAYNNDAFISALLAVAAWTFARQRIIASGLLFGIAVAAKATNTLFVLPFAMWLMWSGNKAEILRGTIAFLVPVMMWLASNALFYGGPFTTSYSNILVRADGELTTEGIERQFQEPFGDGMHRILTHERQGIIPQAPLLLLAILGALWMLTDQQQRAFGAVYLAILALFLGLHAKYAYTYGRFFLPVVGLSVLPLGIFLSRTTQLFDQLAPTRNGAANPWFFAIGILTLIGATVVALQVNPRSTADWSAVDAITTAQVTNGQQACDYFNNLHQKFECHRDKPYQQWGMALGNECVFDDEPQRMLWLHPPSRGRRKITFTIPDSVARLRLRYGLSQVSRYSDITFQVRLGDERITLPSVTEKAKIYVHDVDIPQNQRELTIQVDGEQTGWRHFCLDAESR